MRGEEPNQAGEVPTRKGFRAALGTAIVIDRAALTKATGRSAA